MNFFFSFFVKKKVLYLDIMETYRTPEDTYPTMIFWYPNMSLTSKQELALRSIAPFQQSFFFHIQLMVELLIFHGNLRAENALLDFIWSIWPKL